MQLEAILIGYISASELMLWAWSRRKALPEKPKYLVLLGHKGGEQSPVTQDRVTNAVEALRKWPNAKLIVTGNESKGEITAFRNLLAQNGVSDFQIEDRATTTWGNFKNIMSLLDSKDQHVVIVTSEYHQRRSLMIARSYGLQAHVYGADKRIYKNGFKLWLKERFALWYSWPKALWVRLKN
jgi:uncharacterized SAM-binding protein YcdF (DUF218 family)